MNKLSKEVMTGAKVRAIITTATIWGVLIYGSATLYAGNSVGTRMSEAVTVDGRTLALNGTGIATKLHIHVYVIGLYLESKTTDSRTAITSEEAKRVTLAMLRDISRQQFVQAVEKSILRNSGVPMSALRSRLDVLENTLPALKKGDILGFTYVPSIGTVMQGQGRELKIPGKDFAEALFSVWLGPHAESSVLRHHLLGGD